MAFTDRRNGTVADYAIGSSTVTVAAPTAAQVNALTRIEDGLIDGVSRGRSGSGVPIHALSDRETSEIAGRITNEPITGMCYFEDDGTDTYWAAFDDSASPSTVQYLVVCQYGFTNSTATANDIVDVYTVHVSHRSPETETADDAQRFNFELRVIDTNIGVTVQA